MSFYEQFMLDGASIFVQNYLIDKIIKNKLNDRECFL